MRFRSGDDILMSVDDPSSSQTDRSISHPSPPCLRPAPLTNLEQVLLLLAVMLDLAVTDEAESHGGHAGASQGASGSASRGVSTGVLNFLEQVGFDLHGVRGAPGDLQPALAAHWRLKRASTGSSTSLPPTGA